MSIKTRSINNGGGEGRNLEKVRGKEESPKVGFGFWGNSLLYHVVLGHCSPTFSGHRVWDSPTHRQLLLKSFSKEQEDKALGQLLRVSESLLDFSAKKLASGESKEGSQESKTGSRCSLAKKLKWIWFTNVSCSKFFPAHFLVTGMLAQR